MSLSEEERAGIKSAITSNVRTRLSRGHYSRERGHYGIYHFSGVDKAVEEIAALLQAAREEASQGAGEPVASQSAGAALASAMWGVTLTPASSPNPQARIKALEEALETARDALQAAYQRTGHADDLAAAHIADAAHLRTLETSNV